MSWSVRENGKSYSPDYLFQIFDKQTWDAYPFADEKKLEWFRNAKLGLFFHVGISAVGKVDIGWSRHTHKLPDPNEGSIPDEEYDSWAEKLELKDFCAEEWINLAAQNGFRYVVIITKHHDGFHMWDTEYSDYKITNAPFGRDYLGEMIAACNKINMPVGLYYSQRDWHHPDYEPVDESIAVRTDQIPFYQLKEGETLRSGKRHSNYIKYMRNSVLELMKKYGKIDILWWDAAWYKGMFQEKMWDSWELEKDIRKLQPDIIINNRASIPGDFDTPECQVGFVQRNRPWETCMPMGNEWAWTGNGIKSFEHIMNQFIYTICGDGNYLLSIGARPDGVIAEEETKGIKEIGNWLHKYGVSIYDTRSGPWNPGVYGGSVYKNRVVYLHLLHFNQEYGLNLPLPDKDNPIENIFCLTGEHFEKEYDNTHLKISVVEDCGNVDTIIAVQFKKEISCPKNGIDVDEAGNEFDKKPMIYGQVTLDTECKEKLLDLGTEKKVTAICIQGKEKKWKIESSCDGKIWYSRYMGKKKEENIRFEVHGYVAGAPVCGDTIRYIRVNNADFRIQVYAVEE